VQGTALEDAVLLIERSPIVIDCPSCGEQTLPSAHDFRCPSCLTPCGNVVSGKEMEIVDITLDDVTVTDDALVGGATR
jgi:Zn finger protein HypA/HybF involved in hydrogenase expression